jgi:type VI secretion system secreted protein Hcp
MANDYFLKLDGVEGESQDGKHKGEIEISSFSFGATQTGSFAVGSGAGSGKVHMQDFHFTMPMTKAGPKLLLACASGEHIKNAVLTCRKAGKEQQEYLKVTFKDIMVSSFQIGGSGGDFELPTCSVSLNFSEISTEYKEQLASGQLGGVVKAGWNLQKNQAV